MGLPPPIAPKRCRPRTSCILGNCTPAALNAPWGVSASQIYRAVMAAASKFSQHLPRALSAAHTIVFPPSSFPRISL